MKKLKKLTILGVLLAVVLVAAACDPGWLTTKVTFTDANGAGTREFTISIDKDGRNPDGNLPAANWPSEPGDTTSCFATDPAGLLTFLNTGTKPDGNSTKAVKPAEVGTVVKTEDADKVYYSYTLTFENIGEYNQKVKAIAKYVLTDEQFEEKNFGDATLIIDDAAQKITFKEDFRIYEYVYAWATEAMYNDSAIMNKSVLDAEGVGKAGDLVESGAGKVSTEFVIQITGKTAYEVEHLDDVIQLEPAAKPGVPVLSEKTHNSITVNAVEGARYKLLKADGTLAKNWQRSNTFTDLSANTEYKVVIKLAGTGTSLESPESDALTVTTDAAPKTNSCNNSSAAAVLSVITAGVWLFIRKK